MSTRTESLQFTCPIPLCVLHEIIQKLVPGDPRPDAFAVDPQWDGKQADAKEA